MRDAWLVALPPLLTREPAAEPDRPLTWLPCSLPAADPAWDAESPRSSSTDAASFATFLAPLGF
jgi:hypothetical protein